ncbi:MAG: aspartate aminotransferase family protein [Pseudonocardiaceae bacterium]
MTADEHWSAEQTLLGPGLQSVILASRLCVSNGRGVRLVDLDGKQYLDFFGAAGVNSLGHAHPRYIRALTEQLDDWVVGAFGSPARLDMVSELRSVLPPELDRVQLYSSGTEAVEAALRLAKSATGGFEFLSFWNAFHGRTMGSLAMSHQAGHGLGPGPPGFFGAPYADCSRCPFRLSFPECGFACVEHARETVRQDVVGQLAAIVVEPVQGRAGNIAPPPGYLGALRALADEFGALLIADESMTGFGRTGTMFGFEYDGVAPDVAVFGKGMGGGYPVTAVAASAELMSNSPFGDPSANSSSFGAFPAACRAVATTVQIIREDGLAQAARGLGGQMIAELRNALADASGVGGVTGRGLAIGVQLIADRASRQPLDPAGTRAAFLSLAEQGLLVMTGKSCLRLYPPLTVGAEDCMAAVDILTSVLRLGAGRDRRLRLHRRGQDRGVPSHRRRRGPCGG